MRKLFFISVLLSVFVPKYSNANFFNTHDEHTNFENSLSFESNQISPFSLKSDFGKFDDFSISKKKKNKCFSKGSIVFGTGYGFLTYTYILNKIMHGMAYNFTYKEVGPFSIFGELGIHDKIGLGFIINYYKYEAYWGEAPTSGGSINIFTPDYNKSSVFSIAATGRFHFVTTKKLDIYARAELGFAVNSQKTVVEDLEAKGVYIGEYYGVSAGARYYFIPNFGVFAEVGYSTSVFLTGVNLKL